MESEEIFPDNLADRKYILRSWFLLLIIVIYKFHTINYLDKFIKFYIPSQLIGEIRNFHVKKSWQINNLF